MSTFISDAAKIRIIITKLSFPWIYLQRCIAFERPRIGRDEFCEKAIKNETIALCSCANVWRGMC